MEMLNRVTTTGPSNETETGWYQPLLTIVLPNTTYVTTLSPTMKPTAGTSTRPNSINDLDHETKPMGVSKARSNGLEMSVALLLVFLGFWIVAY
jgi:hypothetical protein